MMRHTAAGVVTIHDLYKYFSGVEHGWSSDFSKAGFTAKSDKANLDLSMKPSAVMFDLHIEAIEDPDDSHDVITDKPIKEIAKFLGEGVPGGEHFEKMSSVGPLELAGILHYAKNLVLSYNINRRQLTALLRRATVLPELRLLRHLKSVAAISLIAREEVDIAEIARLKKELSDKGWKVTERKDERGIPTLDVDIGEIYKASMAVERMMYEYNFKVMGHDDATDSGLTDDPIIEFEKWIKKPSTKSARDFAKSSKPSTPPPSSGEAPTVAPPRRKSED
jgi:hypothetical protein